MATFVLASFDPTESAEQRMKKTTLIRAHAARASHARRQNKPPSRSTPGVPGSHQAPIEPWAENGLDNAVLRAMPLGEVPAEVVPPLFNFINYIPPSIENVRIDPFHCYPVRLQDHEHVLVDYSIQILPYRFYGITHSKHLTFNFFRDIIFPLTLQDPISFRCFVLAISAIHRADMAHISGTSEVEYQQFLSLRMLRRHFLVDSGDLSDAAISMCLFRGVMEAAAGYEQHEACILHMQQVAKLVCLRGGPRSLLYNPRLLVAINVYHYVAHDTDDWMSTISFHSDLVKNWDPGQSLVEQARLEAYNLVEDFIQFQDNVTLLSTVQRTSGFLKLAPFRYSVFQPQSSMSNILSSWEISSLSGWESTRQSFIWSRNQQIYGMSLLLHLNVALWDFRNNTTQLNAFLDDFHRRMERVKGDCNHSVEAAAHAVLSPPSDMLLARSHFDRLWLVGKLLKVAKRLDFKCWHRIRRNLLSNLTFEDRPDDPTLEEDVRIVVMAMPSRSWISAEKSDYH